MRRRRRWRWRLGLVAAAALAVAGAGTVDAAAAAAPAAVCEPIQVEECRGLGYNETSLPNLVGQERQRDAELTLATFRPLVQYGCSAQLRVFLCGVLVPLCTHKVAAPIGPCRALCEAVRARCFPVLRGFGFQWPALLNCSKFPAANNHEAMCMEGPGAEAEAGGAGLEEPAGPEGGGAGGAGGVEGSEGACRVGEWALGGRCVARCHAHVRWAPAEKRLASAWAALWAALCFASSLLAALSLLLDAGAAAAPGGGGRGRAGGRRGGGRRSSGSSGGALPPWAQRPLLCLALSYAAVALGWGVRAAAGRDAVACVPAPGPAPGPGLGPAPALVLAHDGVASAACAVVFLLLYYFGTAAALWWAALCGAWAWACGAGPRASAAAGARGGGGGGARGAGPLLHLLCWGAPAALAVAALLLRAVGADELTGACVAATSTGGGGGGAAALGLVVAPQAVALAAGAAALAAGGARLLVLLRRGKGRGGRGLLRPGLWAALGGVPLACVVAAHALEWSEGGAGGRPPLWAALLRVCMSLAAGAAALPLAWGPGTLRAWRRCFRRVGPYKPAPSKCGLPIQCYSHTDPGTGQLQSVRNTKAHAAAKHCSHHCILQEGNETSV